MRILHVITTIERGGAEIQLLTLTHGLVVDNEVTVLPLKGKLDLEQDFRKLGVTISKACLNKGLFHQVLALRKMMKSESFDLVHAHLPQAEIVTYFLKKSIPVVISRHNAEPIWREIPRALSSLLSRSITRRARYVIAISNSVREFLIQSNEISKTTPVQVVHYGYEKKNYSFRRYEKLKPKELKILTVARLEPQKDLATLVRAFSLHIKCYPNSRLYIAGEGSLRSDLVQIAEALGVDKKIFWLGKIRNVLEVMVSSDVFVLPTKYEGFGMVYLEAMDAQVPILTTENPAAREVLPLGFGGFFSVADYEHLATLLNGLISDNAFKFKITRDYETRLQFFNLTKMISEIKQIYYLAINSRDLKGLH